MKYCDLHVHSNFSDGTSSPKELLKIASDSGLSAIALTDHNTVDGVQTFLKESEKFDVEAIAGVEISSDYMGKDLHILALFIDQAKLKAVKEFLDIPIKRKTESNDLLAKNLLANGYKIDYNAIKREAAGSINRVHFAKELIKNGYISSVQEGFKTILSEEFGLYVAPIRYSSFEVIKFIKSVGAVPVLAHPLLKLSGKELKVFLEQAKECGLVGIETLYSEYSEEEIALSQSIAKDFSLLQSGGSDFHGENKPHIQMGVGMGNLQIPYNIALKLKNSK